MIAVNSKLASYSSPLLASWFAHAIGAVTSFVIIILFNIWSGDRLAIFPKPGAPIWAYLGGIPGAISVVLAAVTVNSPLGLSGSIVLIMAGQVMFGIVSDAFGLFGLVKRSMTFNDGTALILMAIGCLITLFGRG